MAKGSCACGEVKFEYQGEPAGKVNAAEYLAKHNLLIANRAPATVFLAERHLVSETKASQGAEHND